MKIKKILGLLGLGVIGIGILFLKQNTRQVKNDSCKNEDVSEQSSSSESLPVESPSDEPVYNKSHEETAAAVKYNVESSIMKRHQEAGKIMRESLNHIFSEDFSEDHNDNQAKFNKIHNLLNQDEKQL